MVLTLMLTLVSAGRGECGRAHGGGILLEDKAGHPGEEQVREEGVQDPGGDDDGKRHFVIRGASFEFMEEHPGAEEEIAQCWHGRGIGGEGIK